MIESPGTPLPSDPGYTRFIKSIHPQPEEDTIWTASSETYPADEEIRNHQVFLSGSFLSNNLISSSFKKHFDAIQAANAFHELEAAHILKRSPTLKQELPSSERTQNDTMAPMTREELDARLSALSERSDARARETELKAEVRLARFEERMDQAIGEMRRDRADIRAEISELKSDGKTTRTTMVVTAIASVIAIVGGIAAFNATVLGNMQASFQTGKDTGASLATTAEQLKGVAADLKVVQDKLDKQASSPTVPPK